MEAIPYNTYVLNFKAEGPSQIKIINNWIRQSTMIPEAISPIPLVYYFKSHYSAREIREAMDFLFPDPCFLINRVESTVMDGRLPADVWKWFIGESDGGDWNVKPPSIETINGLLTSATRGQ